MTTNIERIKKGENKQERDNGSFIVTRRTHTPPLTHSLTHFWWAFNLQITHKESDILVFDFTLRIFFFDRFLVVLFVRFPFFFV